MPFLILTLGLSLIGLFIITTLAVDSERERFQNNILDASRVGNDYIVNQEKSQLDRMRFLVFADGMAQAMYDKESDKILSLMQPILTGSNVDIIAAIDNTGREIVTFGLNSSSQRYHRQEGVDFSGVESVQKVLQGAVDQQGDKFVEVLQLSQGSVLFTSAPVMDASKKLVGVMMVGSYVDDLLVDMKKLTLADVVLLDNQGTLIQTSFDQQAVGFDNLVKIASLVNPTEPTQPRSVKLNERDYQVAYSPLIIREQVVGWIGVFNNSDYLVSQAAKSRDLYIAVFTFGTILVIVIGFTLARSISFPILKLRAMTQAVAAGDLDQSMNLRQQDEIGDLADAFDMMTLHLRERTEEAERLYGKSQQRNKELAETNARLEAAQLQLIQSEKLAAIGQLTAGIVHDVKNPFAVIMGMSEILAEDEQLDESILHGLKIIRESAVKGNTIVSDLLKFARQSKPEMRYGDLCETVKTAIRLTAYLTRRYNTVTELPPTTVYVTYDPQQIEQVLINLIHNAVQAMPNGGSLYIGLAKVGDCAQIIVRDSGAGIAQENLKRIFDPFFTTKAEGEGTGLGLSVSYGIIANHNGRIDVESKVGKGSEITILLPLTQPTFNASGA